MVQDNGNLLLSVAVDWWWSNVHCLARKDRMHERGGGRGRGRRIYMKRERGKEGGGRGRGRGDRETEGW